MIPRLKPYFNHKELGAIFSKNKNVVEDFEKKFAKKFETEYAIAFLYGRSGLYALLKCLDIKNSEIIMPAYTCVVVAHAIVYSGNIPRFVDISLDNYNMDLDLVEEAVNKNTKAIIGTSLFGYPYNVTRLKEIIKKSGQDILLIQDSAHSFGAEFNNELICNQGDGAIFGLNISKQISSIFGGMITTNNDVIYKKLKNYRDKNFNRATFRKNLAHLLYFLSTYIIFLSPIYGMVNFLERRTKLIDAFTKYYEEGKVDMPKDFMITMPNIDAKVGIAQLEKYEEIKEKRRGIAKFYDKELKNLDGITLPPLIEGATYSHYVPRVNEREKLIRYMRKGGLQIGRLIEYSIPHMKAYEKYSDSEYPNSLKCTSTTINLPNYPDLKKVQIKYIVEQLKEGID